MLSQAEKRRIYQHAYVPEHVPDYVEAISGAQSHLQTNYLCYIRKKHLIFNGYSLDAAPGNVADAYNAACEHFQPATIAILAPEIWLPRQRYALQSADHYYRLDLPLASVNSPVAYMVRRGARELSVGFGSFGKSHKRLIQGFIKSHHLSAAQIHVYRHIQRYLKRSTNARILEARQDDRLVAFSIVDLGSAQYAFYLFHFRAQKPNIPGASDLLFKEMVNLADAAGKKAINLGLGIHAGNRRFKEKWGGRPFMPYRSALIQCTEVDFGTLAAKL